MDERDNQPVADILDAAGEIAAMSPEARMPFAPTGFVSSPSSACSRSSVKRPEQCPKRVVLPIRRFRGRTSWACARCLRITTNALTPPRFG